MVLDAPNSLQIVALEDAKVCVADRVVVSARGLTASIWSAGAVGLPARPGVHACTLTACFFLFITEVFVILVYCIACTAASRCVRGSICD